MMTRVFVVLSLAAVMGCRTAEPVEMGVEEVASVDTDPRVADAPLFENAVEEPSSEVPESMDVVFDLVEPEPVLFTLRRGETLAHFARWADQSVEDIAKQSHLDLNGSYAVGTELAIVLSADERSLLETRRDRHHQTRATAYLKSRRSNTTEFYTVRTGDSAWKVAVERVGMPVWLLESMNPSTDLNSLRPGDRLMVPVFHDTVVEASPNHDDQSTED